jgi:hypothetical protein
VVSNPAITGIEIIATSTSGVLDASPDAVGFDQVAVGDSASTVVSLTNLGVAGDPGVIIDATTITGVDSAEFSDGFDDTTDLTLAPGESTNITVTFSPSTEGAKAATLEVTHSGTGSPLTVSLSGEGFVPSPVGFRVNVGGLSLSGDPVWELDTKSSPSPYVNVGEAGNNTYSTSNTIDMSDPSLPVGTPSALFQSERSDLSALPNMAWDFPVTAGQYEVRLYFAEIWFTAPGKRVFDVSVEGSLVLNDYDVVADVGANTGVMKSFIVTADSNLDIDFGAVVSNPAITGIEIIAVP